MINRNAYLYELSQRISQCPSPVPLSPLERRCLSPHDISTRAISISLSQAAAGSALKRRVVHRTSLISRVTSTEAARNIAPQRRRLAFLPCDLAKIGHPIAGSCAKPTVVTGRVHDVCGARVFLSTRHGAWRTLRRASRHTACQNPSEEKSQVRPYVCICAPHVYMTYICVTVQSGSIAIECCTHISGIYLAAIYMATFFHLPYLGVSQGVRCICTRSKIVFRVALSCKIADYHAIVIKCYSLPRLLLL